MPRKLPWITVSPRPSASSPRTPPLSHRRPSSSTHSDLVGRDLEPLSTPQRAPTSNPVSFTSSISTGQPPRTPSSSPPPETLSTPPPIEFMREGPSSDDGWIMVEDEFTDTAKLFTSHIHQAEYARLKRLARSRPAATLQKLSRGTDGMTARTPNLKRKLERSEGEEGRGDGGDDEERDEYLEDPMLAGLMTSTRKRARDLSGLASKARTRAAAGYSQSPNKGERTRDVIAEEKGRERERLEGRGLGKGAADVRDEEETDTDVDMDVNESQEEEDDDLDVMPREGGKTPARGKFGKDAVADESSPTKDPNKEATDLSDRLTKTPSGDIDPKPPPRGLGNSLFSSARLPKQPRREPSPSPTLAVLSPNGGGRGSRAAAIVARHKAAREEREREERRRASLVDEIPTFIV